MDMAEQRINNNPNDNVRRKQTECIRCGAPSNLNTIPFRGRVVTVCDKCHRYIQS